MGPEIHLIFDYKTREVYDISGNFFRMSDMGYSVSAYANGIGAEIAVNFDKLYPLGG